MATIFYAVAGEGLGHATRSTPIIDHLKKKHDVHVFASDKGYHFLKKKYDVTEIDYFKIIYKNNSAKYLLTFLNNFVRFPIILSKVWRMGKAIKKKKPDLIITDFEPFASYYGLLKGIPVLSIDNQHMITEADHHEIAKDWWWSYFIIRFVVRCFIPKANKKIITSFLQTKTKHKDIHVIKPILQKEIQKLKPKLEDYVFVYQTSTSNKDLLSSLHALKNEKFIVHGFNKNKKSKNVTFRKKDSKQFYKDLESCKAVITNGGFSLMSEALYLKKPVFSIPVEYQFEQTLNALHLHMSGYGVFARATNEYAIDEFLNNLVEYSTYLKDYPQYTNKESFDVIDKQIHQLIKKKKRT